LVVVDKLGGARSDATIVDLLLTPAFSKHWNDG
jgi:hypothetical protein